MLTSFFLSNSTQKHGPQSLEWVNPSTSPASWVSWLLKMANGSMAKSSESTVLHACKPQRSGWKKWAMTSKSFFPIRAIIYC